MQKSPKDRLDGAVGSPPTIHIGFAESILYQIACFHHRANFALGSMTQFKNTTAKAI